MKHQDTQTEGRPAPRQLREDELQRVNGGLRLDGIRGESTDSKHKSEIDVQS